MTQRDCAHAAPSSACSHSACECHHRHHHRHHRCYACWQWCARAFAAACHAVEMHRFRSARRHARTHSDSYIPQRAMSHRRARPRRRRRRRVRASACLWRRVPAQPTIVAFVVYALWHIADSRAHHGSCRRRRRLSLMRLVAAPAVARYGRCIAAPRSWNRSPPPSPRCQRRSHEHSHHLYSVPEVNVAAYANKEVNRCVRAVAAVFTCTRCGISLTLELITARVVVDAA